VLVLVTLLACKKGKKEQTESTATAAEEIGIPECDEFLRKYEKCVSEKYPEISRAAAKQQIENMRNTWKQTAANPLTKSALAGGCKQALETTKQSTAVMGCEW